MNYKETAKVILENVGGQENINDFLHCSTRLRMNLKDPTIAKTEEIKAMDGVMEPYTAGTVSSYYR